jgi:hypothetical protein
MHEFGNFPPENQEAETPSQQVAQAIAARLEQLCPGDWREDSPFHLVVTDTSLQAKFQSLTGVLESGVAIIKNENEIRILEQSNVSGENNFILIKEKGKWRLQNLEQLYELTALLGLITQVIKTTEQKKIE